MALRAKRPVLLGHSRTNFKAFTEEGGKGTFIEYSLPPWQDAHFLFNKKGLWEKDLTRYLQNLELDW